MRFLKTSDFKKGWIIGNFNPSLYTSKDIEVGLARHKKGEKGDGHFHEIAIEYTFIIRGKVKADNRILEDGDVFVIEKKERTYVEFLEDTDILVIKLPSMPGDKYY